MSYDDFSDCHDKISIASVVFIGRHQFVAFNCKGNWDALVWRGELERLERARATW